MAPSQSGQAWWDQVVQLGLDIGTRLSSQERAVRNARVATTDLSRARVERDAVELYLADLEGGRSAAGEHPSDGRVPHQRAEDVDRVDRADRADRAGRVGHPGA